MRILETRVAPEWVDYNGHMNDAEYARVFSLALEALMDAIGLDKKGRDQHAYTIYTLETHLCYRREAYENQSLGINIILLDRDTKRLHVFMEMLDEHNQCLATSEQMLMGIATVSGRPAAFPTAITEHIARLPHAQAENWPALAGRKVGLSR
ncbi:thioesterase family protein [Halomonas halocynthiae]|uniref:thioesterase family protein n=1 Tax=Halomonas halocynthiae TaxID=176290 RepID=UPI00040A888A|nr:thioesterase family protein [Halomonas halocynthiae]